MSNTTIHSAWYPISKKSLPRSHQTRVKPSIPKHHHQHPSIASTHISIGMRLIELTHESDPTYLYLQVYLYMIRRYTRRHNNFLTILLVYITRRWLCEPVAAPFVCDVVCAGLQLDYLGCMLDAVASACR